MTRIAPLPFDPAARAILAQAAMRAHSGFATDGSTSDPVRTIVSGGHLLSSLEAGVPPTIPTVAPNTLQTPLLRQIVADARILATDAGAPAVGVDHLHAAVDRVMRTTGIDPDALLRARATVHLRQ